MNQEENLDHLTETDAEALWLQLERLKNEHKEKREYLLKQLDFLEGWEKTYGECMMLGLEIIAIKEIQNKLAEKLPL